LEQVAVVGHLSLAEERDVLVSPLEQELGGHAAADGVVDRDAAEAWSFELDEHRGEVLFIQALRDLVVERDRHDDHPVETLSQGERRKR
jgi:hypothetical protein